MESHRGTEDVELIEAVKSGDSTAFSDIDSKWRPILYGFFTRKGQRQLDAEDLVQQTLFAVWEKRDHFDSTVGSFSSWIRQIASRLLIDGLRRRNRMKRDGQRYHDEIDEMNEPCETVDYSDFETRDVIMDAIESLPHDLQTPCVAYMKGQKASRTGAYLGVCAGTVKERFSVACDRMRNNSTLLQLVGQKDRGVGSSLAFNEVRRTRKEVVLKPVQKLLFEE